LFLGAQAIRRRRFSEKSDVWAFGVLMWEMWSYAEIPFGGIGDDAEVSLGALSASGRRPRLGPPCQGGLAPRGAVAKGGEG
jgi:hypothetical protein